MSSPLSSLRIAGVTAAVTAGGLAAYYLTKLYEKYVSQPTKPKPIITEKKAERTLVVLLSAALQRNKVRICGCY